MYLAGLHIYMAASSFGIVATDSIVNRIRYFLLEVFSKGNYEENYAVKYLTNRRMFYTLNKYHRARCGGKMVVRS